MNIELTNDQKHAVKLAVKTLMEPNSIFQISGPGGSGKTTIAKRIARKLLESQTVVKIICCAPTHKACKVLRESTKRFTQTIQAFLNMEIEYDEKGRAKYVLSSPRLDTKKEELEYNLTRNDVLSRTLIMIDEISMVSDEICDTILKYKEKYGFRVITLGDSAQLPPVNQEKPAFYERFPIDVQFTENLRNSDVAYNKLLNRVRNMILQGETQLKPFDVYCMMKDGQRAGVVDTCQHLLKGSNKHKELKTKSLRQAIKRIDFTKDLLLAYRTTSTTSPTVTKLNKRSRRRLYGKDVDEYVTGERLMVTGYISYCLLHDKYTHVCSDEQEIETSYQEHNEIRLNKCDDLIVVDVMKTKYAFYEKEFTTWRLLIQTDDGVKFPIYRVIKKERDSFDKYKKEVWNECRNECLLLSRDDRHKVWTRYYKNVNTIHAPVYYSYAMSVHMSQGSTTNDVYLYITDFLWLLYNPTPENTTLFLKLLYTGLSRAKSRAVVF